MLIFNSTIEIKGRNLNGINGEVLNGRSLFMDDAVEFFPLSQLNCGEDWGKLKKIKKHQV